ncbi:MAG: hypothetical protein ACK587_06885 [Cyanobacteriota bacterium]
MTLLEAVMASLVLMIGTSAAAQLWSQGLRTSLELARREQRLQQLETLLLSSEGLARDGAVHLGTANDCSAAEARLLSRLRALPSAAEATLTRPASSPGTLHLRWEADGVRRERIFSHSALGLCQEGSDGA